MTREKVAQERWAWAGELSRFGAVALLLFAVDWSVLRLAVEAGAPALLGRPCSLAASVCVGFAANRAFTFRAAGPPTWEEARAYAAAAGAGVALNYAVFAGLTAAGAGHAPAIAAGMGAAAALTFTRFRGIFAAA